MVEGDYIGTDVTGTKALANGQDGVQIVGGATFNTVGGTTAGARDIISGNAILGVFILATGTEHNVVEGDYIGTNAAGTGAVAQQRKRPGHRSPGRASTRWAARTAAARDIISGNALDGVELESSGHRLQRGRGRTISAPTSPAPRRWPTARTAWLIDGGASFNTVGGTTAGARNVISGNAVVGVYITGAGTSSLMWSRATTSAPTPLEPGRSQRHQRPGHRLRGDVQHGRRNDGGARDVISGNTFNGVVLAFAGTDL